jgi:TetR/AcrR family transcriptional regulator
MSVVADWKGMFDAGSTDPAQGAGDYIRSKIRLAFDKPEISRIFTREVLDGGRNLEKFWPDSRKNTREKVAVINGWIARGLMQPWTRTPFYSASGR